VKEYGLVLSGQMDRQDALGGAATHVSGSITWTGRMTDETGAACHEHTPSDHLHE
jgi:hypothetical protein